MSVVLAWRNGVHIARLEAARAAGRCRAATLRGRSKLQRHLRGLWLFDLWYPHRSQKEVCLTSTSSWDSGLFYLDAKTRSQGGKMTRKSQKAIAERKKQTCEVNTGAKREKKDILSFFSLFPAVFKKAARRQALSTSVVTSTQSLANEFDKFQAKSKSKLAIEDYWSIWRNRSGWLSTLMPSEYKDQAVSYCKLPQGSATWILSREDYSKLVTHAVKEWRQWPADALKNRWTLWKSWRTWRSSLVRWTSNCQRRWEPRTADAMELQDQCRQRTSCYKLQTPGSRIETDAPEVADGLQAMFRAYCCRARWSHWAY